MTEYIANATTQDGALAERLMRFLEDLKKYFLESEEKPQPAPQQQTKPQPEPQSQQQGGGFNPLSMFFGSGSAGGAGGGGTAAASSEGGMAQMGQYWPAAVILAAIAGQHAASESTGTSFEGHQTGDAFGGNFATEPWLAYVREQLGLDPSAGERLDASIAQGNVGDIMRRMLPVADYWTDPARTGITTGVEGVAGKKVAQVLDPISAILKFIG